MDFPPDTTEKQAPKSKVSKLFRNDRFGPDFETEIAFDGSLPFDVRATLLKDLIKYILYIRGQVPDPIDILMQQNEAENKDVSTRLPSLTARRRKVFLEKLSKVFDFIDDAFSCSEFVPAVALVLGATLVSAKESYLVSFPAPTAATVAVPVTSAPARRKFLSSVVSQDLPSQLRDASKLSSHVSSSLHVALKAPRDCRLNFELAQPHMTGLARLRRGAVVSLRVKCHHGDDESWTDRRLSLAPSCDSCHNMSGVEPFEVAGSDGQRMNNLDHMIEEASRHFHDSFSIYDDENCKKIDCGLTEDEPLCSAHDGSGNDSISESSFDQDSLDPLIRSRSRLEMEGDYIWFVCKQSVRGLKPHKMS